MAVVDAGKERTQGTCVRMCVCMSFITAMPDAHNLLFLHHNTHRLGRQRPDHHARQLCGVAVHGGGRGGHPREPLHLRAGWWTALESSKAYRIHCQAPILILDCLHIPIYLSTGLPRPAPQGPAPPPQLLGRGPRLPGAYVALFSSRREEGGHDVPTDTPLPRDCAPPPIHPNPTQPNPKQTR